MEGYRNPSDGINLGLHEMAHAVKLNAGDNSFLFNTKFESYIANWEHSTYLAFCAFRAGNIDFLRKYGGTNTDEFFAVCVEHFFEVPEKFKENVPDLYNYLRNMLNQDSLLIENNYGVFLHTINKK